MKCLLTCGLVVAALSFGACANEQASKIPGRAEPVASATGDASYRAAQDGTIYVYDKTWNKLVYTGAVRQDQMIKVEPENSRVLVDGRPVVEQTPLGGADRYDFFLDTSSPAGGRTVERRTVIEREVHE
ncbi:MAG: hypothetical protein ACTHN5_14850 [Phycisphaerae bacterium]